MLIACYMVTVRCLDSLEDKMWSRSASAIPHCARALNHTLTLSHSQYTHCCFSAWPVALCRACFFAWAKRGLVSSRYLKSLASSSKLTSSRYLTCLTPWVCLVSLPSLWCILCPKFDVLPVGVLMSWTFLCQVFVWCLWQVCMYFMCFDSCTCLWCLQRFRINMV